MSSSDIVALYADGGCISKNPSPLGITWAWCAVNAAGVRVIERSGIVRTASTKRAHLSNNHAEQIALCLALEAMPDGWSGTVYSDSMIALGRVFEDWATRNLPRNIQQRSEAARVRLGVIKHVLLQGHPTKADLERGIGAKRGLPVSAHNQWCDKACAAEARKFLETMEINS